MSVWVGASRKRFQRRVFVAQLRETLRDYAREENVINPLEGQTAATHGGQALALAREQPWESPLIHLIQ